MSTLIGRTLSRRPVVTCRRKNFRLTGAQPKIIRKDKNGYEIFDDYFSDVEKESEDMSDESQSPKNERRLKRMSSFSRIESSSGSEEVDDQIEMPNSGSARKSLVNSQNKSVENAKETCDEDLGQLRLSSSSNLNITTNSKKVMIMTFDEKLKEADDVFNHFEDDASKEEELEMVSADEQSFGGAPRLDLRRKTILNNSERKLAEVNRRLSSTPIDKNKTIPYKSPNITRIYKNPKVNNMKPAGRKSFSFFQLRKSGRTIHDLASLNQSRISSISNKYIGNSLQTSQKNRNDINNNSNARNQTLRLNKIRDLANQNGGKSINGLESSKNKLVLPFDDDWEEESLDEDSGKLDKSEDSDNEWQDGDYAMTEEERQVELERLKKKREFTRIYLEKSNSTNRSYAVSNKRAKNADKSIKKMEDDNDGNLIEEFVEDEKNGAKLRSENLSSSSSRKGEKRNSNREDSHEMAEVEEFINDDDDDDEMPSGYLDKERIISEVVKNGYARKKSISTSMRSVKGKKIDKMADIDEFIDNEFPSEHMERITSNDIENDDNKEKKSISKFGKRKSVNPKVKGGRKSIMPQKKGRKSIMPQKKGRKSIMPQKKTPIKKTPIVKTPIKKTPIVKTPIKKTPIVKTPIKKTSIVNTPIKKTPIVKTPIVKTPIKKTPIMKTPIKKTPIKKNNVKQGVKRVLRDKESDSSNANHETVRKSQRLRSNNSNEEQISIKSPILNNVEQISIKTPLMNNEGRVLRNRTLMTPNKESNEDSKRKSVKTSEKTSFNEINKEQVLTRPELSPIVSPDSPIDDNEGHLLTRNPFSLDINPNNEEQVLIRPELSPIVSPDSPIDDNEGHLMTRNRFSLDISPNNEEQMSINKNRGRNQSIKRRLMSGNEDIDEEIGPNDVEEANLVIDLNKSKEITSKRKNVRSVSKQTEEKTVKKRRKNRNDDSLGGSGDNNKSKPVRNTKAKPQKKVPAKKPVGKKRIELHQNDLEDEITSHSGSSDLPDAVSMGPKSTSENNNEKRNVNKRPREVSLTELENPKEKKKLIYPVIDENSNLRRSKRTRIPRLDRWCFERPKYKLDEFRCPYVVGITSPIEFPPFKRKPRIVKQKEQKKNTSEDEDEDDPESVTEDTSMVSVPVQPLPVINPETNGVVYIDLVSKYNSVRFSGPTGEEVKDTDPYIMTTSWEQRTLSSGFLIVRSLCEKPIHRLGDHSMVFTLLSGKVMVTIHCTTFEAKKKDTFLVPIGNKYQIQNTTNKEAVLSFTRIFNG